MIQSTRLKICVIFFVVGLVGAKGQSNAKLICVFKEAANVKVKCDAGYSATCCSCNHGCSNWITLFGNVCICGCGDKYAGAVCCKIAKTTTGPII